MLFSTDDSVRKGRNRSTQMKPTYPTRGPHDILNLNYIRLANLKKHTCHCESLKLFVGMVAT